MLINLSELSFVNDFCSIALPDGSTLNLNKLEESIKIEKVSETNINVISIEIIDLEDNQTLIPNIIGLSNDILSINTDYKEYEGKVLSPENMEYCTIEVYE